MKPATPAERLAVALDALRDAQEDAPEELLRLMREATDDGCAECVGWDAIRGYHSSKCRVAHWLRVFGGEAERQRQVDAAHEEAARAHHRRGTQTVNIADQTWTFSDDATAAQMAEAINAECRMGAVASVDKDENGKDIVNVGVMMAPWWDAPRTVAGRLHQLEELATASFVEQQQPRSRVPRHVAERQQRFRRGGRG